MEHGNKAPYEIVVEDKIISYLKDTERQLKEIVYVHMRNGRDVNFIDLIHQLNAIQSYTHRHSDEKDKEIKKLKKEIRKKKKELEFLKLHIKYMPGGNGYMETKKDFEKKAETVTNGIKSLDDFTNNEDKTINRFVI